MATEDNNSFPLKIREDSHILFEARKYYFVSPSAGDQAGIKIGNPVWTCALYPPAGIVESLQSNWSVEGVLPSVATGESIKLMGDVSIDNILGVIGTSITSAAAERSGKAGATLNVAKGLAFAPNEMAIFRGMRNKNLQLTFEMVPSSEKEANEIRQIVNRFKLTSQPRYKTEVGGTIPLLEVPHIFNIKILGKNKQVENGRVRYSKDGKVGGEPTSIVSFDAMAITDFSVAYGGGQQATLFMENGSPMITTLTINFQSIRPAYRNSTDMRIPKEDFLKSMKTGKEDNK